MVICDEIKKIVRGEVLSDEKTLKNYSCDYSIFEVKPQVVVLPKDKEDIKNLVKFVAQRREKGENISLTARSAGTDMTGGPLNDSIIVDFKALNHIKEITNDYVVVEPGLYFRELEEKLTARGLMYPPYPASKDLCAIGGIIMNNSGGEKSLRFGKSENYVLELKMILRDGEEHTFRPLSLGLLHLKQKEKSLEGEIYAKLYNLIEKNYEIIKAAKPAVSKNSAGYFLWNVLDKTKNTFDITKILVGSQGTLGLLTEAKLKVIKSTRYEELVVIFLKDLNLVPVIVNHLLKFNPESIESYDDRTFKLALKFLPSLLKLMKGNLLKLALKFLPEIYLILKGGLPKIVVLASFSSDEKSSLEKVVAEVVQELKNFPVQVKVAKDWQGQQKYWTIRRQSFNLLHSRVKGLEAAPFVDDIIVKPEYLPEFLPKVNAILDKYKNNLIYTIAGHLGDGNFHIIPLMDLKNPETRKIILKISEEVYELTIKYGGSITAEHNDGLIRSPYLSKMYGEKIINLFEEVKNIFDPLNIFNPRKKVNSSFTYLLEHIKHK